MKNAKKYEFKDNNIVKTYTKKIKMNTDFTVEYRNWIEKLSEENFNILVLTQLAAKT